jgi:hypothetical protein
MVGRFSEVHTLGASTFLIIGSLSDFGSLYVPVGEDALPRYARTSPLVNIPRTPVPLMSPGFSITFSTNNLWTDGNKGFECFGGSDGWAG